LGDMNRAGNGGRTMLKSPIKNTALFGSGVWQKCRIYRKWKERV